jgi:hypothetical protein
MLCTEVYFPMYSLYGRYTIQDIDDIRLHQYSSAAPPMPLVRGKRGSSRPEVGNFAEVNRQAESFPELFPSACKSSPAVQAEEQHQTAAQATYRERLVPRQSRS